MAEAVTATVATVAVAAATIARMVAEASGKALEEAAPLLKCLLQGHPLASDYENNDDNTDKSRSSNEDPSADFGKESLVPNKLVQAPPQTAKVSFLERYKCIYSKLGEALPLKDPRYLFVLHQMSLFIYQL